VPKAKACRAQPGWEQTGAEEPGGESKRRKLTAVKREPGVQEADQQAARFRLRSHPWLCRPAEGRLLDRNAQQAGDRDSAEGII